MRRLLLRARRRDEAGSALVELVWLGILLLVPVVYSVLARFTPARMGREFPDEDEE